MRHDASILHIDLDAFFASVEQRDKPSLRGKPVIVGGINGRGVVSTASYEARQFGVHSALSTAVAMRRCPHGNYLYPRIDAYRQSSRVVMNLLRQMSPLVEPLSIDEAFVDLRAATSDFGDLRDVGNLTRVASRLREEIAVATHGLTASVGIASSKFMAKIASEQAKPDGIVVIKPGDELEQLRGLPVRAVPGVGPATAEKLARIGITTVDHLQLASVKELVREVGQASGVALHRLAFAEDDREVHPDREAKSISIEDTFADDIFARGDLDNRIDRDSAYVANKLVRDNVFARTVTIKIRFADFTTVTRSKTLAGATDDAARIALISRQLLDGVELSRGVRLLGVGVSNFTTAAQEELFDCNDESEILENIQLPTHPQPRRELTQWVTGMEIEHGEFGRGWVWGSGLGRVTVRFETRLTKVGPVRTFAIDDPQLSRPSFLPLNDEDALVVDDRGTGEGTRTLTLCSTGT